MHTLVSIYILDIGSAFEFSAPPPLPACSINLYTFILPVYRFFAWVTDNFCYRFEMHTHVVSIYIQGVRTWGPIAPPSSVVGNALVVIDDGIESLNVKNRYQGARVSARRANREPEDGIRWKFVHGRVVVVR